MRPCSLVNHRDVMLDIRDAQCKTTNLPFISRKKLFKSLQISKHLLIILPGNNLLLLFSHLLTLFTWFVCLLSWKVFCSLLYYSLIVGANKAFSFFPVVYITAVWCISQVCTGVHGLWQVSWLAGTSRDGHHWLGEKSMQPTYAVTWHGGHSFGGIHDTQKC